jgi:acyl carrier protein
MYLMQRCCYGRGSTSNKNLAAGGFNNMSDAEVSVLSEFVSSKILKNASKQVAPDAPLISSGLIDSFSLVDLALFVEDTFGVRIEDTELNAQTFDTLDQLANLIRARKAL